MSEYAALVFAGGASRRMGHNKATLRVGGHRLVERVVAAVSSAREVTIVGGEANDFVGISARWVADKYPGEGPLGALHTGFLSTTDETVVSVACDLPHLSTTAVELLVDELARSGADVCVPLVDGALQWHVVAWSRRCAPVVADAFTGGRRSLRAVGLGLRTAAVVVADSEGFADIDTPADLERAFPSESIEDRPDYHPERA